MGARASSARFVRVIRCFRAPRLTLISLSALGGYEACTGSTPAYLADGHICCTVKQESHFHIESTSIYIFCHLTSKFYIYSENQPCFQQLLASSKQGLLFCSSSVCTGPRRSAMWISVKRGANAFVSSSINATTIYRRVYGAVTWARCTQRHRSC